jgi:disulfide bond formation protein DsbB
VIVTASTAPATRARTLRNRSTNLAQTAASSFHPQGIVRPALTAALATAALAAAALAGAWFFQLVLEIVPCPLCLEQRYAYYLAVPLALLVALGAAKDAPRTMLVIGFALLAAAALYNAGLGGYHAGVEWGFWPGPTECTGPVLDLGKGGNVLDNLDKVKVVRCDEVQWRFLRLSLAGYNMLISLAMAAIAGWGIVKSQARSRARA